jgi:hypothetical protein
MRISALAFIASAVLLVGFAASTKADPGKGGPPDASAIITGRVECLEDTSGVFRLLFAGEGLGGIIGVPGAGFNLGGKGTGTCAESLAALKAQLPSPLCATGPSVGGPPDSFNYACSGVARSVLEAVGGLAKGVITP